ncbi:MAG: hypothetical protein HKN12_03750 [Gemmatimonadetes bacterium]|nr:hypothetical protein [Gemmatimonadota bacterium]
MFRALIIGLSGLLFVGTSVVAGHPKDNDDLWLHVSVDGGDSERVRVNVPLALVETVLPLIDESEFSHGKLRIEGEELSHEDIVAILRAVRDADDGEYITVQDGDEHVRVSKENRYIKVHVEEDNGRGDNVNIRIPVEILEALVSGDDDELDVIAAVRALKNHANGDLVTVMDEDGTEVRIWVDNKNSSD